MTALPPVSTQRGPGPSQAALLYAAQAARDAAPWCAAEGCKHRAEAAHGVGLGHRYCPVHEEER